LGIRNKTLHQKIDLYTTQEDILEGVCGYLFMDFHSLMNHEIFYSYQPEYLHNRFHLLSQAELEELDELALLLQHPDDVIHKKKELWKNHEKFFILTNHDLNDLIDFYRMQK
ncbi:MAG: hypothetical protein K2P63_15380, partial [Lachnospiraceae bacterium]|nr:hypothetical protein [Lachnospiraceae bacterium]